MTDKTDPDNTVEAMIYAAGKWRADDGLRCGCGHLPVAHSDAGQHECLTKGCSCQQMGDLR